MRNLSFWLLTWLLPVVLGTVIVLSYFNRTVYPPAEILGMSAYLHNGSMVYEIRTYHGYHKLTKEQFIKYNIGDKYERP